MDSGDILVDTNRQIFIKKSTATEMSIYNLNDGTLKKTLNMPNGIDFYKFIENKAKLAIFTGLYWNSPRYEIYDCNTWELTKTLPSPDSMSFLSLISDDGELLIGSKLLNGIPIVYLYNIKEMKLQDTIQLETADEYGYVTHTPGTIEISHDNKYIFTSTGYQKWQLYPDATIYNVYDIKSKTKILRFARGSITKEVISNDWKYLYIAESEYISQTGKVILILNRISVNNSEKTIVNKFNDLEISTKLFISDNDKYLIFDTPNMDIPAKTINLFNFDIIENNGLPVRKEVWLIQKISDGFIFFAGNNLSCFSTKDTYLTGIIDNLNQKDTIYPNPTTNIIIINNIIPEGKTFKMTDISGREIPITNKIKITGNGITIDLTGFNAGSYYFTIADKISSKTYTIIKY